jgi:cellulose biosynthesis protein BcsQ
MPTIVFVSPKLGAEKTTAALALASQLVSSYDVTLIDADPNRPTKVWASGGNTLNVENFALEVLCGLSSTSSEIRQWEVA